MSSALVRRSVVWLGGVATAWMFLVLVTGTTVTSTGSAEGCGHDWPLCHGRFIPDLALRTTAIEFRHRLGSGVAVVLILALAGSVLWLWRERRPLRVLAALMVGSLFGQAGLGAWAVIYPQQPAVLALHFGVSLLAVASTALTAIYVHGLQGEAEAPPPGLPAGLRLATWALAAYAYLVVYLGAFVRHLGAAAACPSWPLCQGGVENPGWLAVNVAHRFAAGLALVGAVGLLLAYRRLRPVRPDLALGGWLLLASLLLEAASGVVLVGSRWSLLGELLHASLTGVTFTAIAYLCLRVSLGPQVALPASRPERLLIP